MKKILFAFFFIALFASPAFASHLMGGEITWTCLGSGQFVFNMKLYRDCNGVAAPTSGLYIRVHNCPGLTRIPINLVSNIDNSPVCNAAGPVITCDSAISQPGWPTSATPVQGAVSEYIYHSDPVYISGTPPASGWIFTFDDCCRNASITNIPFASNLGFTLRAKMFSYNGRNTNPCYDSSPEFFEKPKAIVCTGYPFAFNPNAEDAELDSLHYAWAQPLDWFDGSCDTIFTPTCPQALNFAPGYSYTDPLPDTSIDPRNVPATLNPNTGEIQFTPFTQGNYVMALEVSAYKCGTLVAQVYREIQVILSACSDLTPGVPNNPPHVVPPFIDSLGAHTLYIDTVYAGTLVDFFLSCTDLDSTPGGGYQNLTMTASGAEFDTAFTNSNGVCLLPPCATLTPPPSVLYGQKTLSTEFKWQTTCNNLNRGITCARYSNVYTFVIKSSDDFCPIPGITLSTITIVVLPPPVSAPVISQSNDTLFCNTDSAYASYQWYFNGNLIAGATDTTLVISQFGTYSIHVTGKNSCGDSISITTVGIKDFVANNYFSLSPNPASGQVAIHDSFLKQGEGVTISIMNVLGERIQVEKMKWSNDMPVNIKTLPAGIYFLELKTEAGSSARRFVKE